MEKKCPKCKAVLEPQSGGDSLDFGYESDYWLECMGCGYTCDIPK